MTKTPTQPTVNGSYWSSATLGAMIDRGHRLALYCDEWPNNCGFVKWIDLPKLASHLGRDHSSLAPDILPHLWCLKCGGRRVTIRDHPPVPGVGNAHFHG